jgi:ABC-type nitrate/sulfonate/bicarbonate transport system permease component
MMTNSRDVEPVSLVGDEPGFDSPSMPSDAAPAPDQTVGEVPATSGPPPVTVVDRSLEAVTASGSPPRARNSWERIALGALGIAIVVAIYTAVATLGIKNNAIMPTPSRIFSTGLHNLSNGTIPDAIWASLKRVLAGYAVGSAAGIIIGTSMGWFKRIEYLISPLVEAIRPIPGLAFVPLVILWFGIGETSKVIVIAEAAFVVSVVNARAGMKEVANTYVEAAETLGASRFQVFYSVALPSAVPYLFAGLRVALAVSWATLVAAELIAAQQGLGYLLQEGSQFFQTDLVMVVIVFIGALATVMDQLLKFVQRRVTRWAEVKR